MSFHHQLIYGILNSGADKLPRKELIYFILKRNALNR